MLIRCPYCGSPTRTRTSSQESMVVRECRQQCQNLECGHEFVAHLVLHQTTRLPRGIADLLPPRLPNAWEELLPLELPISKHLRREINLRIE